MVRHSHVVCRQHEYEQRVTRGYPLETLPPGYYPWRKSPKDNRRGSVRVRTRLVGRIGSVAAWSMG